MPADKPGRAATLIPYARSILQAMKENGYRGTVWDEVLNEYEKATAPLPETGSIEDVREKLRKSIEREQELERLLAEARGERNYFMGLVPPAPVSARPLPCDESLRVAEKLEDNRKEIAAFFQERNWPDTKLGNAASAIDWNMPVILKLLRTGEVRSTIGASENRLRLALEELVACKDIKERIKAIESGPNEGNLAKGAALLSLQAEYETRQPVAWAAARSALSATQQIPK